MKWKEMPVISLSLGQGLVDQRQCYGMERGARRELCW